MPFGYDERVTLDQLLAFRAVASLGTFAAAATALHKSQPAISKLVQNLEAELGITLFDRAAYRAKLTDTGQLFFERAADVVADTEALHAFGVALGKGGEPFVRLVVDAVTPLAPVLAALGDVQSLFPAVRYELRTERMTGAVDALRDESADMALASRRGMDTRTMIARRFFDVRIIPVARRDHPLAKIGGVLPAAQLRKFAQVVLRDSTRGDLAQSLNVLSGGLRWTVTDVAAKLQIIEAGLGWGGLPEHVVASGIQTGKLVPLSVREFDVGVIELFAIKRRGRRAGPVAEALWARLRR